MSEKISNPVKPLILRALLIEKQIQSEQKSHWPDWLRLLRLKKLRLMIKDRIQRVAQRKKIQGFAGKG